MLGHKVSRGTQKAVGFLPALVQIAVGMGLLWLVWWIVSSIGLAPSQRDFLHALFNHLWGKL